MCTKRGEKSKTEATKETTSKDKQNTEKIEPQETREELTATREAAKRNPTSDQTETETEEKDEAKTTDKEKEEANKSSMNTKCENPQRLMLFSLAPAEPTAAKTTEQEHQEETNRHKAGSKQTTQ